MSEKTFLAQNKAYGKGILKRPEKDIITFNISTDFILRRGGFEHVFLNPSIDELVVRLWDAPLIGDVVYVVNKHLTHRLILKTSLVTDIELTRVYGRERVEIRWDGTDWWVFL
jgi:hypothetical protein